jgi:hypothetical protein
MDQVIKILTKSIERTVEVLFIHSLRPESTTKVYMVLPEL